MPPLSSPPDIPEGLEHLLPAFVAEMVKDTARLTALARAVSAPDQVLALVELADHAHAMRGKAGLFGENCLYGLLTDMEKQAQAENIAALAPLLELVVERTGQLEVYGRESFAGPA